MSACRTPITVRPAQKAEDVDAVIALFKAYALSLGIDLTFQDFATEVASMPGKYAPPTGALLLARTSAGDAVGCVGLRPLPTAGHGCCEMKRLYVDPKGRGLGVGRALAETVVREARTLGYKSILLDTLSSMTSALTLYKSLGFVEVEKYYDTPLQNTVFLRLDLDVEINDKIEV